MEEVFEKIGAFIEDLVKWLRFLFDWDDILATRDYLRESILNMLDRMGRTMKDFKKPVKQFFDAAEDLLDNQFDKIIGELGYAVEKEAETKGKLTKKIVGEVLDMVSTGQWILSKILSAGPGGILFALDGIIPGGGDASVDPEGDAKLEGYWTDILAGVLDEGLAIPEGLFDVIRALVQRPDEPLYAVAVLLDKLRDLAVGLLEVGENMILGLLDLAAYLIEKFKKFISADIRIPFLADLLEWLGLQGTLGFSILDAITLILAIPITAISKIVTGEAPFNHVPKLAMNTDGWDIAVGVSSLLGGLASIPLDIVPEGEDDKLGAWGNFLEAFSWLCALVSFMPGGAQLLSGSQDPDESADGWDWWLFGYDIGILVLDLGTFAYGWITKTREIQSRAFTLELSIEPPVGPPKNKTRKMERFKRGNEWTILIASGLGVVHAFLLIGEKHFQLKKELLEVCTTLPEIGSFLRLSVIAKSPIAPIAIPSLVTFDIVAAVTPLALIIWDEISD